VKLIARTFMRIACAVAISFVLYFVVAAVSYRASWSHEAKGSADVIIVMGAAQYDGSAFELVRDAFAAGVLIYGKTAVRH
jgi:hypothetical protein